MLSELTWLHFVGLLLLNSTRPCAMGSEKFFIEMVLLRWFKQSYSEVSIAERAPLVV